MDCKKIRDLIATDYIDTELSVALQKEIRQHLDSCGACRQFEQALRKASVEPFKTAKEIKPPDFVWERIKEGIQVRERGSLLDYLRGLLSRPRPVFALGTALAAFITVAVVINISLGSRRQFNSYLQEQREFLSGLTADTGDYPAGNQVDFGNIL
jgi:predicted anti-sigma-YlaC factor YlaD